MTTAVTVMMTRVSPPSDAPTATPAVRVSVSVPVGECNRYCHCHTVLWVQFSTSIHA